MRTTLIALAAAACTAPGALAQELIANGGFESSFTGWTAADQLGSDGSFTLQTGAASPVNAFPVPLPPGGLTAAMTDQQAGGSHVHSPDILIPSYEPEYTCLTWILLFLHRLQLHLIIFAPISSSIWQGRPMFRAPLLIQPEHCKQTFLQSYISFNLSSV